MLRFFRQFRKSIFTTVTVRKYLLYATGEIALVVIGILIALQINNWNQHRIDGKKEKRIVQALYEELNTNLEYLENRRSAYHDRVEKGAMYLLNLTGPNAPDLSPDSLIFYLQMTFGISTFGPYTSTLTSVVNGPEFNFIRQDTLKYLLNQCIVDIEKTERYEIVRRQVRFEFFTRYYRDKIGGSHYSRIMMDVAKEFNYLDEQISPGMDPSDFEFNAVNILRDKVFETFIAEYLEMYYWTENTLIATIKHITSTKDFMQRHYPLLTREIIKE